ncbi:MAG: hypothetical protein IJX75_02380 [Clostridia bacterium]|nr:hypothetical protein [Clostridia bacterium]
MLARYDNVAHKLVYAYARYDRTIPYKSHFVITRSKVFPCHYEEQSDEVI